MQEQTPQDITPAFAAPGSQLTHLARRFFGFVTSAAPTPRDQAEVHALLGERAGRLFWSQCRQDQRHAIDVMHTTLRIRPGDRVAARAALLHDVGKRHSELGAVGRSLATVGGWLPVPLPRRWASYRNHGKLGANDLESIGEDEFVVAFTRHHPSPPPPGTDLQRWAAVAAADHAAS
jgi:putative nucleotidyltransferase with HDIG domain